MTGRIGLSLTLWLTTPLASAQELDSFYFEPLEGVYSQTWSGRVIGPDPASGILVFLRGDGKSGDFWGVLSIDCDRPEWSTWQAVGGFLSADQVPGEAIAAMRAQACG